MRTFSGCLPNRSISPFSPIVTTTFKRSSRSAATIVSKTPAVVL